MKAETTKRALSPIVTPCFWDISPADLWLPPPLSPPPLPWVTDRKSAETSQSLWEVTATTRPASASAPPLHSQGRVGIGTTTPYAELTVQGEIQATNLIATSTTATSTLVGGLNVGKGGLVYDYSSGIPSIAAAQLGSLNFDDDAGAV